MSGATASRSWRTCTVVARTTRPLGQQSQGVNTRRSCNFKGSQSPSAKTLELLRSGLSDLKGRSFESDIRGRDTGSLTSQPGPGVPRRLNFQETLLYHKMLSLVSWAWTDSNFSMIMFCLEWSLLRRVLLLQPGFFFFFLNAVFKKVRGRSSTVTWSPPKAQALRAARLPCPRAFLSDL